MGEKRKITIHQTLHGYQEGHRLLATSIELTSAEKTVMSQLSDSSGTGKEAGFTNYLTGYPLANSRYYVLARTWYADEMPRPGCVWTHSLLIDIAMVWMFTDPEQLLHLFLRPTPPSHLSYHKPISIEIEEKSIPNHHDPTLNKLSCLLYSSDQKLILLAESAQQYELLILKAWNLQWPRLKRGFRFCTGSLSIRKVGGDIFDLQIVPYLRERSLSRIDRAQVDTVDLSVVVCQTDWSKYYTQIEPAKMLEFMTQFGADLKPVKSRFAAMVRAFEFREKHLQDSKLELFRFWEENFADPEEGKQLKVFLFEQLFRTMSKSRFQLLLGILTNKFWSTIDWDYKTLVLYAWETNSLTTVQLIRLLNELINCAFNPVGILVQLPTELWIDDLHLYSQVLPELSLKISPTVLQDIWSASDEVQFVWWEHLQPMIANSPNEFVNAMLDKDNGRFAQDIYAILGDKVFQLLYDWMDVSNRMPVVDWQYLIVLNPAQAFKQLSIHKKFQIYSLSLFLNNVSPTSQDWQKVPHKSFINFFNECEKYPTSPLKIAVYTYFLTVCLTGNVDEPHLLVRLLFQPLHDSLEADNIDRDSWQRFKMELGRDLYVLLELDFFSKHFKDRQEVPDWDRCEFLRRSLLSSFLKFKWNIAMLLEVVHNEDTFEKIVEFGVDVKPIKKLFKSLKKGLEFGPLSQSIYFKILKRHV